MSLPSAGTARLTLRDALGCEVATPPNLAPGVYHAQLAAAGVVTARTLVVVR